jgi:hypothetical protein
MVVVIMGLKYVFRDQLLNAYVELAIYVVSGSLAYLLGIGLTARQLYQELLGIVNLVLPKWKFRKI